MSRLSGLTIRVGCPVTAPRLRKPSRSVVSRGGWAWAGTPGASRASPKRVRQARVRSCVFIGISFRESAAAVQRHDDHYAETVEKRAHEEETDQRGRLSPKTQ